MTPTECLNALRASGWSVGDAVFVGKWIVSGTNGENAIMAQGSTQSEAWVRAVEQARSLGMFRNTVTILGGRF